MERQDLLSGITELKPRGMRDSFDEIIGKGIALRAEFYPLIAALIRAEHTHRQTRLISYRIGRTKFPVLKDLAKFNFAKTVINEALVRELATVAFLDAERNAIFIGGTGTGKAHLASPWSQPSSAPKPVVFLKPSRFCQSIGARRSHRPQRPAGGTTAALRHERHRWAGVLAIQPDQRPVAVPPDQEAL